MRRISIPNVSISWLRVAQKQGAFQAYARYDPPVESACATPASCVTAGFGLEFSREDAAFEPKPFPTG